MSTEKDKKSIDNNERTRKTFKKGDGTMSAVTQNFVYTFGKKQDGKKENTISREKLKEAKESLAKFLSEKK